MTSANPFPAPSSGGRARVPKWGDRTFFAVTAAGAVGVVGLLIAFVVVLYWGAQPAIEMLGPSFLYTKTWNPSGEVYGILPFVAGTLITSFLALLIAIPLSLGAALFLTQHAPAWIRGPVGQVIELLAAIPSVIYGFWGLIVLVPIMRYTIEPNLWYYFGWTGLFSPLFLGLDVLSASVVLSIMTIPTITAISRDSIAAVPRSQKEAAISLGATDWEVSRHAVLPYARNGIVAGVTLGLGRALGETMAVALLIGGRNAIPANLFSQGQTITSLIATDFFEAANPTEVPALIEMGLFLLILTLVINLGARVVLSRFQAGRGVGVE